MSATEKPGKILLTTDLSITSAIAYPYAAYAAKASGATLEVLNILENPVITYSIPDYLPPPDEIEKMRRAIKTKVQTQLQKIVEDHFSDLPVTVSSFEHMGSAGDAIVEHARRGSFQLIVLATHGHGLLGRVMLGSVAERVLRHAPCPVLVVPCGGEKGRLPHVPYKRIIVTTDFSEGSKDVFEYVLRESQRSNAQISLVHVLEHPFAPELLKIPSPFTYSQIEDIQNNYKEGVRQHLREFSANSCLKGIAVTLLVEKTYSVADSITSYANAYGADLIVISTRGAGNRVMLFSGVVERVVRQALCPVLVFPSPHQAHS